MKQKIYEILHENKLFIKFIYSLILFNIIAIILESYKELRDSYGFVFQLIEVFSVLVFTIEYALRLWVADLDNKVKYSRFKFALSPIGLIDLFAILPFYLPMIFSMDLRVIRILRLLRLLRIFKLGRFSSSLKTINQVLKETKADLTITLFVVFILLVLSSTLMYYVESDAQPEKFASIVHSFWWSIATLTTVGYGDVYPITAMGKVLSAIIALIGVGFIALPTGIISSAFINKLQNEKAKAKYANTRIVGQNLIRKFNK
ncbi:MAG: ion transporter [Saprospiraceae bacterium]